MWLNEKNQTRLSHECGIYAEFASVLYRTATLFRQEPLYKWGECVDGNRKDRRGIFLCGDFHQRLEIPELKGSGVLTNHVGGLCEFLCGLKLSLRMDDFGTAFSLSLGLSGDGPLHVLRNIDVLHLNGRDLHAPWFGLLIDDSL